MRPTYIYSPPKKPILGTNHRKQIIGSLLPWKFAIFEPVKSEQKQKEGKKPAFNTS
jgi:hypothetical protein